MMGWRNNGGRQNKNLQWRVRGGPRPGTSAAAAPTLALKYATLLLQQCGCRKFLEQGKRLHALIIKIGLQANLFVANHLISMYNKCQSVSDARRVFDTMPIRNTFSWNTMIGGYAQQGSVVEAFDLFHLMQQQQQVNVKPDRITFIQLLNACARSEALALGKLTHSLIVDEGVEANVVIGTALVYMYGKCGNIKRAREMFDNMPERNVVSWNAMIAGYIRHGCGKAALILFHQMQQGGGVQPNKVTCTIILKACADPQILPTGKCVHAFIVGKKLQSDVVVGHALVNMYRKCGSVKDAYRLFISMTEKHVIAWNALIAGYIEHGYDDEALKLYQQMQQEGMELNEITFTSILNVCSRPESITMGKLLHAHIINAGFDSHSIVRNALISMYGRCGSVNDAGRIFESMGKRNLVSWNGMIAVYAQHGHGAEACHLFRKMQQEGLKPDKITFISMLSVCAYLNDLALGRLIHTHIINRGIQFDVVLETALVNMYGKCGSIKDAHRIFDRMPVRNIIAWTAIITGYCKDGCGGEAFNLFKKMQHEGVKPDKISFISILNACATPEVLELGKLVHKHIVEAGVEVDITLGNALVSMYGKCGSIVDARSMFDSMSRRDTVSWNAMIAAYAQHGYGQESLEMFEKMQSKCGKPDKVTFISVLNVCSHAGFVDKGLHYFSSMSRDFDITPAVEHYNCLVDLFSRAGRLEEANDLIDNMPFQPNAVMWMSLLGSCRIHGCIDPGEHAVEQAREVEPQSASLYVMLSNIYAAAGRWDDVAKIRKQIGL